MLASSRLAVPVAVACLTFLNSLPAMAADVDGRCWGDKQEEVEGEFLGTVEVKVNAFFTCDFQLSKGEIAAVLVRTSTNKVEDTDYEKCEWWGGSCRARSVSVEKSHAVQGSTYRYLIGVELELFYGGRWERVGPGCSGVGKRVARCVVKGEMKAFAPPDMPTPGSQSVPPTCLGDELCATLLEGGFEDSLRYVIGEATSLLAPADPYLGTVDNAPDAPIDEDPEPHVDMSWFWCLVEPSWCWDGPPF